MQLHSTGATVVAQSGEPGPVDLVRDVIKEMPDAKRAERFVRFREMLADYDDYQRTVDNYFFVNMHDYLTTHAYPVDTYRPPC